MPVLPASQDVLEVVPDRGGNILEFIPGVNEGLAELEHSQGGLLQPQLPSCWTVGILLPVLTYHNHCVRRKDEATEPHPWLQPGCTQHSK